tara:strand:- start:7660 stop:8523 length:864 start_codon:yes stop_codon:yes gene_type:complete
MKLDNIKINKSRTLLHRDLLYRNKYFKLDYFNSKYSTKESIEYLTYIYTIVGCSAFNIEINPTMVQLLNNVISEAMNSDKYLNSNSFCRPFITISLYNITQKQKLFNAIEKSIYEGAEVIEFQPVNSDKESIVSSINELGKAFTDNVISLKLNREFLSNTSMIEVIKKASDLIKERLMIEIISFKNDVISKNSNNELETLSTVDIINKRLKQKDQLYQSIPILLPSNLNGNLCKLARQCQVDFNGVNVYFDSLKDAYKYIKKYNLIDRNLIIKDLLYAQKHIKNSFV